MTTRTGTTTDTGTTTATSANIGAAKTAPQSQAATPAPNIRRGRGSSRVIRKTENQHAKTSTRDRRRARRGRRLNDEETEINIEECGEVTEDQSGSRAQQEHKEARASREPQARTQAVGVQTASP
jgi:hypothetical protein